MNRWWSLIKEAHITLQFNSLKHKWNSLWMILISRDELISSDSLFPKKNYNSEKKNSGSWGKKCGSSSKDNNSYVKKLVFQILVGRMLVLFPGEKKTKIILTRKNSIRYSSEKKVCSPHSTILNILLAEFHIWSKLIKKITVFVLHPRMSIRFTMTMTDSSLSEDQWEESWINISIWATAHQSLP